MNVRRGLLAAAVLLLLIGGLVLLIPASVDTGDPVSCGNALVGSDKPGYRDAGRSIADAISGTSLSRDEPTFAEQCASKLTIRKAIGWPVAIVGLVALVGVLAAGRSTGTPRAA